jgi:hypothetical protein
MKWVVEDETAIVGRFIQSCMTEKYVVFTPHVCAQFVSDYIVAIDKKNLQVKTYDLHCEGEQRKPGEQLVINNIINDKIIMQDHKREEFICIDLDTNEITQIPWTVKKGNYKVYLPKDEIVKESRFFTLDGFMNSI